MSRKTTTPTPSFSRAPFAHELLTDETQKRFNELPGWERHFIRRVIDHGDLARAAHEAGVSRHAKEIVDLKAADKKTMVEALEQGGLTPGVLVTYLMECVEAKTQIVDKHRNIVPGVNLALRLKALELIFHLRGDLQKKKSVDEDPKTEDLFPDTEVK